MIDLKTREHLIYFMQCGMMRLSKYDLQFIQNIQIIVTQHKPLTVNQVNLFEKLVEKYKRQLNKHGIDDSKIVSLKWKCDIIPSEPAFTHAHISVSDGTIYLRSPFNKKFIKEFREHKQNTFIWNKERRRYESPYSTAALKQVVDVTHKFYTDINYCPITTELLNSICDYSDKDIWNPTLVYRNGRYYIIALNEYLNEATKHIPLNNEFKTLDMLSRYGITVEESVTCSDKKLEFASSYHITKSIEDLENIINWIKELGCDAAYFSGTGALTTALKRDMELLLEKENIRSITRPEFFINKDLAVSLKNFKYSVLFQLGSVLTPTSLIDKDIHKIVCLKNPTPIVCK